MKKILIIGGGASGMTAALTAAEDPGNSVTLLERQQRVGRKLLATGNGRCNLTNTGASPDNYHGEQPEFVLPALEKFPPHSAMEFFGSLGLITVTEPGGRVYPLSDSANSVVDVLRFALEQADVKIVSSCPVRELIYCSGRYTAVTDNERFEADKVIVACGGAAGAKLGGVFDGYELMKSLGHRRTKLYPSLVQIITESDYPRALKGVRADADIRLYSAGELIAHSEGELQFTDRGVSGPAAFDISRAASTAGESAYLCISFLREYSADRVFELLKMRCRRFPSLPASELFTGMLHNRLGRMVVKYSAINTASALSELSEDDLRRAAASCTDFRLKLRGTEGFDNAQVTAGGLKTEEFDPETMESRLHPGLFACGELLDVDGDCGGYNLQWAWASGRLAGRLGK